MKPAAPAPRSRLTTVDKPVSASGVFSLTEVSVDVGLDDRVGLGVVGLRPPINEFDPSLPEARPDQDIWSSLKF